MYLFRTFYSGSSFYVFSVKMKNGAINISILLKNKKRNLHKPKTQTRACIPALVTSYMSLLRAVIGSLHYLSLL